MRSALDCVRDPAARLHLDKALIEHTRNYVSQFIHRIRTLIGGICGESMLYSGTVPEASSLDEIMLSQALCFDRTGSHVNAKSLWNDVWRETCITIKRHEPIARKLIAAFDQKDIVEGPELHAILREGDG
jgi:hypothetical protein